MPDSPSVAERRDGPSLPNWLRRKKKWLADHHMTLVTMADTPHSIALGSAIGMFFGFTPLYSLKTLLSIAFAWICRSNKLASAITSNLHDIFLVAMPAVYFFEYKIGCWVVRRPTPPKPFHHFVFGDYFDWHFLMRVIWPALIGSVFIGVPAALLTYFVMRLLISRARAPQLAS
ncbi:MAG TPA: DUF2062 domain-containing protein [Chthoniobacterales bacterium]|nr:DUF2062 domain-containing protein [Chthoniobacterales bacterium]